MELSQKIYELRTGSGLSQLDLAEKLGVSRQSVSKWETGQAVPDLDKLIRLADLFGISVDELVREGERPLPRSHRWFMRRNREGSPLSRRRELPWRSWACWAWCWAVWGSYP